MGVRIPVRAGSMTFESKKAAKDYFADVLKSFQQPTEGEKEALLDLFRRHPEWAFRMNDAEPIGVIIDEAQYWRETDHAMGGTNYGRSFFVVTDDPKNRFVFFSVSSAIDQRVSHDREIRVSPCHPNDFMPGTQAESAMEELGFAFADEDTQQKVETSLTDEGPVAKVNVFGML